MNVIKRCGKVEPLTKKKIFDSICRANDSVKVEDSLTQKQIKRISDSIASYCENLEEPIEIDVLEDVIEKKIMEASGYEVAKAYITYRYEKERVRFNKSITEKLTASNVQNQNANVDEFSFSGRMGETASFVTKQYALEYLMSKKAKHNHNNNEIYIHDLDSFGVGSHNCLTIPFDDLLEKGFKSRQCDVRPAGSLSTAFQLVAVIFQMQSLQQFGGVAASHLDWTMIPYVRLSFWKNFVKGTKYFEENVDIDSPEVPSWLKDIFSEDSSVRKTTSKKISIDNEYCKKTYPKSYDFALKELNIELNQSVEGMYHNLNTIQSRSSGQLPFTSINYGTSTAIEGRMVIRALLENSIKGVGQQYKTPIFPCGIFQCMKGVNRKPGDPNYDLFRLALESTSKRIYPNYANIDWSGNAGYDRDNPKTYFSTMGCFAKDTPIMMSDGSLKMSQDIEIGDKLMGVNGQTRIVETLIRGNATLFEISQSNGENYVVNEGHVLSLKKKSGEVVNIRLHDFLSLPDPERKSLFGYKDGSDVLSEISVKKLSEGDFFGFDLDGDRLHLLGDRTVTHNCRTANGWDINCDDPKLGQLKDGRGNICPVTLILPELAMQSKIKAEKNKTDVISEFMKLLEKKIGEAKDMLIERFDWICSQPAKSAKFMYENHTMYGYKPEEGIRSALKHGTLAIGQLGLAEALQILIGCDHTTEKGMELAIEIETLFKDKAAKYKKEYKLNFGVYYTPAENLCFTAKNKFFERYGSIPNVSDRKFFTNSIHVPVWHKMTPFEKIDIESKLTGFSNAGCITYVEMDASTQNNIDALEELVNYAMDRDIPYFAVNLPIDECECGHSGDLGETCPICGSSNISRLRRVTGYLSTSYKHFNPGKQDEVERRVKHTGVEA